MHKVIFLNSKSKKSGIKILIIEERSVIRDCFIDKSYREVYELTFVDNADNLTTYIEKKSPDVILIDTAATRMNVYNILKMLRFYEKTRHTPVILISTLNNGDDLQKSIELGASDYVISPFDATELVKKIQQIIE